jgi:hypothetical protein
MCDTCGENFSVLPYRVENEDKKYCSVECQHEEQKNRVKSDCSVCGSTFEYPKSSNRQFCSWDCRNEGIKCRNKTDCEWCGSTFEHHKSDDRKFCSVSCTEKWFSSEERPTSNGTGEDHWAYRGGGGSKWYGPNWLDNREIARERTDLCEYPECDNSDSLQCHHIVPFRYFEGEDGTDYELANDIENLMMLCVKHHNVMDARIRRIEQASGYENKS